MIPDAFIQYLVHFHGDRDYFECHEILEEYWKETEPRKKDSVFVGFIQLAVSAYHHRRGNFSGAQRTLAKAAKILATEKDKCERLAICHSALMELIKKQEHVIETGKPYESINLPIIDEELLAACKQVCKRQGLRWGEKSNLLDEGLINRHSLRDRSDVIRERNSALKKRKRN